MKIAVVAIYALLLVAAMFCRCADARGGAGDIGDLHVHKHLVAPDAVNVSYTPTHPEQWLPYTVGSVTDALDHAKLASFQQEFATSPTAVLARDVTFVSSGPLIGRSVRLPAPTVGRVCRVINDGFVLLGVRYGGGAVGSVLLPGASAAYLAVSPTHWRRIA